MTDLVSDEEARTLLCRKCRNRGDAKLLADRTGMSKTSISRMISGELRVTSRVAATIGLQPVRAFVRR